MATLQVDNLRFTFKPSIAARKYDDSRHFQESWRLQGGHKAVDVVAMRMQAAPAEVWLIEAKDFRTITDSRGPWTGKSGTRSRACGTEPQGRRTRKRKLTRQYLKFKKGPSPLDRLLANSPQA